MSDHPAQHMLSAPTANDLSVIRRACRAFLFLTVASMINSATVSAEDSSPAPHLSLVGKMVCVGASITVGEGVKPEQSYVGLLKKEVEAEKLDLQIVRQGRSGWSTSTYVKNKDAVVEAMPADANIVTILLGTNDAREGGSLNEIGQRAAGNLGKLIDLYQAKATRATFVIICPTRSFPEKMTKRLHDAHYGEQTPAELEAIDTQYKLLAKQRGLLFIDLSQFPSTADNSIDGIHPNAAGHQELFQAIWRSLSAAAGAATKP